VTATPTPTPTGTATPTPTPTPSPTDTPPDEVPPTPTPPDERTCPVEATEGSFEPSQGVWQDDYDFEDRPTKRLSGGPTRYRAELDMVQDRATLLFGVRGFSEPEFDSVRDRIVIKGQATGTRSAPVGMRFTLTDGVGTRGIHTTDALARIPLVGPCGPPQPFEVRLDARFGVPPPGDGAFYFRNAGEYLLEAELVRFDGTPGGVPVRGTVVEVRGNVVKTRGPTTMIVPIALSPPSGQDIVALRRRAAELAARASAVIPDYFPLAPGGITVRAGPFQELEVDVTWFGWVKSALTPTITDENYREDALREYLTMQMGTGGFLSGAERVVALLRAADFPLVEPDPDETAAVTTSTKFIVIPLPENLLTNPRSRVADSTLAELLAHELAHTMPFDWSSAAMTALCGLDYHNPTLPRRPGPDDLARVTRLRQVANGQRITVDGAVIDDFAGRRMARMESRPSLMSGGDQLRRAWIDQCTYRNLVEQLVSPPDPALILVRGRLAREGGRVVGQLLPGYQLMGVPDLAAGAGGDWAIVLRRADGGELARFPFAPQWTTSAEHGRERNVLGLAYRVPDLPGTASIDLVGPGGARMDTLRVSANAPTVSITSPADGSSLVALRDGIVEVRWVGADQDGDALLYTALYSPDGGETWTDMAVDRTETVFRARVERPGDDHRVRVIVTDGTRTSEAVVGFSVRHRVIVPWSPRVGIGPGQ
jgi:hypothetical protein